MQRSTRNFMVWHERSESELVLYFSNIQFNNDWESNSNRFAFHTLIKSKSQKNVLKALRSQSNSGYGAGKFRCQLTVQSLIPPPSQCDCGRRKVVSLGNDHHFLSRKLILKKKTFLQSRIVGGDFTLPNEFTMMAGLVDTRDRYVYCGGTIIATNYVLTSAHCLTNREATSLSILVGDYDYASSMIKFLTY